MTFCLPCCYVLVVITRSKVFRSIAETIVPEVRDLDDAAWLSCVRIVEHALVQRPAAMQRQIALFIRVLNVIALFKHGRTLPALIPSMRTKFLEEIQDSRVLLIRRGFWGVRTLIFMGFYARPEAVAHVGYRAQKLGWSVR